MPSPMQPPYPSNAAPGPVPGAVPPGAVPMGAAPGPVPGTVPPSAAPYGVAAGAVPPGAVPPGPVPGAVPMNNAYAPRGFAGTAAQFSVPTTNRRVSMPYGYAASVPPVPPAQPAAPASPAGQGASVPAGEKKGRGWIVAIVILAALIALIGFYSIFTSLTDEMEPKVAVIDINGTIGSDGGANTPLGLLSYLNEAQAREDVAAVVLRVDSGGGAAAAGEEMAQYVKDFAKPVVVSSASMNASAAYLISSQADYIYASKASSVGSIGTVLQLTDYSGLLTTLGIKVTNITSSDSKDSSSGTRPLTKKEIAFYQGLVDQINENFIASVAEGRHMKIKTVRKYATGLAFTGTDAVNMGLIDEIGTYEAALSKAAELAGVSSYSITMLQEDASGVSKLLDVLLGSSNDINISIDAKAVDGADDLVKDGYALK